VFHTEEMGKRNAIAISDHCYHVELNGAPQIEATATQFAEDWETPLPGK
jgi:hypothetical protein